MSSASEAGPGRKRMLGAAAVLCTTCASAMIGLGGTAVAEPDSKFSDLSWSGTASTAPANAPAPAQATAGHSESLPAPELPPPPPVVPIGVRIVEAAAAKAGSPYSYGSTGPSSFDCSGLTQFAHRAVGIEIPRTSAAQAAAAKPVSRDQAQPGDLVFFGSGGGVYHAAVYAGGGMMWTAPQSGDVVKLQKIFSSNYSVGRFW